MVAYQKVAHQKVAWLGCAGFILGFENKGGILMQSEHFN